MFRFICPGCGKRFKLQDDNDGKSGKCSACGASFTIKKPEPPTEKMLCPKCQSTIEKGSIICIECGYNFRTGKKLVEKVKEAKPTADETMEEITALPDKFTLQPNIIASAAVGIAVLLLTMYFGLRSDPSQSQSEEDVNPPGGIEIAVGEAPTPKNAVAGDTVEPIEGVKLPEMVATPSEIYPDRHWDVFYYLSPDRPRGLVIQQTGQGHGKTYFEASVAVQREIPTEELVSIFGRPDSISETFTKTFYYKSNLPALESTSEQPESEAVEQKEVKGALWVYGPLHLILQNDRPAYMWISGEEDTDAASPGTVATKIMAASVFTDKINLSRELSIHIFNKTPAKISIFFGNSEVPEEVQYQGPASFRPPDYQIPEPSIERVISPKAIEVFPLKNEKDFSATIFFDDGSVSIKKKVFILEPEVWTFTFKDSIRSKFPDLIWSRAKGEDIRAAMAMTAPDFDVLIPIVDLGDGPAGEFQTIMTPAEVTCIKFSPNSGQILSGDQNGGLYSWDIKTGNSVQEYAGHTNAITCISFSPDKKLILTGSASGMLYLWDVAFGKPLSSVKAHSAAIRCISWSEYSTLVVTGSDDSAAMLLDTRDGRLNLIKREFDKPLQNPGKVLGVEFDIYGFLIKAISTPFPSQINTSTLPWLISRTYKLNGLPVSSTRKDLSGVANCLALSSDNGLMLAGFGNSIGGAIFTRIDSEQTEDVIFIGDEAKGEINAVALSHDSQSALTGGRQKVVALWDTQSGIPRASFTGHTREITSVCFSENEKYAASGSLDNTIRVYRLPDKEQGDQYALRNTNFEVQIKAIEFLQNNPDRNTADLLLELLDDENYLLQRKVAEALGELGKKSAVEPLIKLIGGDEAVALDLSRFMPFGYTGRPGDSSNFVVPKVNPFASEGNAKYEAMKALSKIGGNPATKILFYWLNDKELGNMAFEALKFTKDNQAVSYLIQLSMTDPLPAVSILSQIELDNARSQALKIIRRILSSGTSSEKSQAIGMLKTMKTPDAILELLRDTEVKELRVEAEKALQELEYNNEINYSGYIGSLLNALENQQSETARRIAAKLMQHTQDPNAVIPLINALGDKSPIISGLAADTLAQLLNPEAIAQLLNLLENPSQPLKDGACNTLQKISGQKYPADSPAWQEWWGNNQEAFSEKYKESLSRK
ncbi:MAG: HEAT repeat domain-containing protein [Planctomycetes bacterium]|nr:HEAT repeat domain-containing protein [Planctomycetota bacterium]